MERGIRKTKRQLIAKRVQLDSLPDGDPAKSDAQNDYDKLSLKLTEQNRQYNDFCREHDLQPQYSRNKVSGFDYTETKRSNAAYKRLANKANSMYNTGSEAGNIKAYQRDLPIRKKIGSEEYPLTLHEGRQNKHIAGTNEYNIAAQKTEDGKVSTISISSEEVKKLVDTYHGTGVLLKYKSGQWRGIERITNAPDAIGSVYSADLEEWQATSTFTIHYSKKGYHIVPDYPDRKGTKQKE